MTEWHILFLCIDRKLSYLSQVAQVSVECILLQELLEGEVHAVVPEMLWVRRQVDTLSVLVCQTDITINSKPVLQWKNHPHSWAIHVLINDEFGNFW